MTPVLVHLHTNNFSKHHGGPDLPYLRYGRIGSAARPIFTQLATPLDQLNPYDSAQNVTDGPICYDCTHAGDSREHAGVVKYTIRHASVEHVRQCAAHIQYCLDQEEAEAPLVRAGWL